MALSDDDRAFIDAHPAAAMITVKRNGMPHAVRVGIALVDDKLWSSGTTDRARTAHLRRDPRCTLFVFDPGFASLTLETTATILEGPETLPLSVKLFRKMQGKPTGPLSWFGGELDDAEFMQKMVEEGRLIYEFEIHHAYGLR
jgi:PPOX class probable F420-dependent enzyme